MTTPRVTPAAPEASTEQKQRFALERAQIDASARVPVLLFFGTAIFWLLVGTLFGVLTSIKSHAPGFLDGSAWLTFGRTRPVHLNAIAFGWVSLSTFGIMLWLMARLSRSPIRYPSLLVVACVLWNLGVVVGIVSLLAGKGTSIEWLEFPPYVPPILVAGYVFIATWALATFRLRKEHHVYVSQWYLLAALFWLPWLYTVANLLLIYAPVKGVTQSVVNWWFGHNWLGLWVTPVALASAYYLIPKVYGRPVYSYYLSILGFWSLALFYNWAGMHHLVGGPVPNWLVAASAVGSMMMLIPVGAVAVNHHRTAFPRWEWKAIWESHRILWSSPTLRFVIFGAVSYTFVSAQGALQSLPIINKTTHFTHYTVAHAHFGLYGFYSMIAFGSMYYIVPRLTGWEWASPRLIKLHFWSVVIGFYVIFFGVLTIGGWYQGVMMNDPLPPNWNQAWLMLMGWATLVTLLTFFVCKLVFWPEKWGRPLGITAAVFVTLGLVATWLHGEYPKVTEDMVGKYLPFNDIVKFTIPYLGVRTLGGTLMAVGHVSFAILFFLNVRRKGEKREGPTLLLAQEAPQEPALAGR